MEKLIILLIIALGSAVSNYLQNKKKREAEEQDRKGPAPQKPSGAPPIPHWPRTSRDWQEEIRRVLQGKIEPPKIPQPPSSRPSAPPVARVGSKMVSAKPQSERSEGQQVFPSPLTQSTTAYARASQLAGRVGLRLEAVDAQTEKHKPIAVAQRVGPSGSVILRRWTQNPQSLREAFIASLIFAPPAGLRTSD